MVAVPLDGESHCIRLHHDLLWLITVVLARISLLEGRGGRVSGFEDTVYLLGSYQPSASALTGHQTIARISASDLVHLRLHKLLVRTVDDQWRSLYRAASTELEAIEPKNLFGPMVSEASWVYHGDRYLAVSLTVVELFIQICSSQAILGPYQCSYVAEVPAVFQHPRLIAYAAKVHLDLVSSSTTDGRLPLVASFVSNLKDDPSGLFRPENMDVYVPKFLVIQPKK